MDNYFNKINTGLAETSCYAITNKTAFNLQQNLFPIRGAADGYIRQCIDYLKTVKNVYICKYNLVANQSMSSNIKSTIDISIESNMNTDTSNSNSLINNVLEKKCLEWVGQIKIEYDKIQYCKVVGDLLWVLGVDTLASYELSELELRSAQVLKPKILLARGLPLILTSRLSIV